MVSLFFNSIFSSYDNQLDDDDDSVFQIEDKSEPYNIDLLNVYLMGLMKEYLPENHYQVLRLSYGLDCERQQANDIAKFIGFNMATANVRVSQLKKEAIDLLISSVDRTQVIDYL